MSASQQVLVMSAAANPQAVALYNAMVSYWNFNENDAGTTFDDAVGSNNLTARETAGTAATSSVTTSTGVIESRGFNANTAEGRTAYIPNASNFEFPNTNWTIGGWFRNTSNTGGSTRYIMGNIGDASGWQCYLALNSTNHDLQCAVSTDGVAVAANVDTGYVATGGVFAFMTFTLDRTNNQIIARWREVGAGSLSSGTTAFAGALFTGVGTANFNINDALQNDSTYLAGDRAGVVVADLCFYVGKAITDAEFNYLYNGGSGKTWTQITTDSGH